MQLVIMFNFYTLYFIVRNETLEPGIIQNAVMRAQLADALHDEIIAKPLILACFWSCCASVAAKYATLLSQVEGPVLIIN